MGEQTEVHLRPGPHAPGAPRPALVMRREQRVVEVVISNEQLEPRAADRPASLELVQRHVYARAVELRQRALDAPATNPRCHVAVLDLGLAHQRKVRAPDISENGSRHDAEEELVTPPELILQEPMTVLGRVRPAQART